jgi:8-oxo-dGTP pyrophosphatase MutT (NUDIX family)
LNDLPEQTEQPETIRQAATILLVRQQTTPDRLEVYMTKRPSSMRFLASHYVFPGGQMDDEDHDPRYVQHSMTLTATLNPEGLPLAYWVCALREAFEEVGILLARDSAGRLVDSQQYREQRKRLLDGQLRLIDLLEEEQLVLATDLMRYFGHRLTPRRVSKKRFDTRYFLTILPDGQTPEPHPGEVEVDEWYDVATALSGEAQGEMEMVPPTVDSLRVIGRYQRAEDLWHSAEGVGTPTAEELA